MDTAYPQRRSGKWPPVGDWWPINIPGEILPSPAKQIMWIPALARPPRWALLMPMDMASTTSGATYANGPGTGTIHALRIRVEGTFPMRMGIIILVDEGTVFSLYSVG